ncbi:hypothetical protein SDC9_209436 [bioreactor metagenome]|uniref:Uncharacterized protein n=1 Tax=bioreactor metagenome TaxID=1076179 RepID=A0A645JMZ3_9ZZZZ
MGGGEGHHMGDAGLVKVGGDLGDVGIGGVEYLILLEPQEAPLRMVRTGLEHDKTPFLFSVVQVIYNMNGIFYSSFKKKIWRSTVSGLYLFTNYLEGNKKWM